MGTPSNPFLVERNSHRQIHHQTSKSFQKSAQWHYSSFRFSASRNHIKKVPISPVKMSPWPPHLLGLPSNEQVREAVPSQIRSTWPFCTIVVPPSLMPHHRSVRKNNEKKRCFFCDHLRQRSASFSPGRQRRWNSIAFGVSIAFSKP